METLPNVFPKNETLTFEMLVKRLEYFRSAFHSIQAWRDPVHHARYRVLAKDNIGVEEFPTMAGSKALENLMLPDAFIVDRLVRAGVDVFGKTTMSELANFVSTTMPGGYSEMGGQSINPYGEEFSPRGSSSGSAIAVAAGLCDAALGTETSGSIVLPAMACGVWGMKPTVGLLSRGGIVPLSHTFDTPGVMARGVQTIVDLMNIMQESDPDDPITERAHEIHLDVMGYKHGSPVRVAVMVFEDRQLQFEQVQLLQALQDKLAKVNIEVVTVEVKHVDLDYKAITSIDFQNDINRFFRRYSDAYHVGDVESLVAYYKAREEHHPFGFDRLTDALDYDADAEGYEDLVFETVTRANAAIEEAMARAQAQALIAFDFVNWWAIAQAPYMAVPWGVDMNGKPVGFTLGCRSMEDGKVIALSRRIEKALAQ